MLMSSDHQEKDLALKSPVTTDKDGLSLFISLKSFSDHFIFTVAHF